jgi:hypothetical protein
MKYAAWMTSERRRLIEMHQARYPRRLELTEAFPRHPYNSIYEMARALGLRRRPLPQPLQRIQQIRWLRLAHLHFQQREAGLLA